MLELEVKPLPQVLRRSYHLMDDGSPRCYLKANFRLKNGLEKYLLEVDTSDNKKHLSTRIVRMKPGVNPSQAICTNIERHCAGLTAMADEHRSVL